MNARRTAGPRHSRANISLGRSSRGLASWVGSRRPRGLAGLRGSAAEPHCHARVHVPDTAGCVAVPPNDVDVPSALVGQARCDGRQPREVCDKRDAIPAASGCSSPPTVFRRAPASSWGACAPSRPPRPLGLVTGRQAQPNILEKTCRRSHHVRVRAGGQEGAN